MHQYGIKSGFLCYYLKMLYQARTEAKVQVFRSSRFVTTAISNWTLHSLKTPFLISDAGVRVFGSPLWYEKGRILQKQSNNVGRRRIKASEERNSLRIGSLVELLSPVKPNSTNSAAPLYYLFTFEEWETSHPVIFIRVFMWAPL